MMGGPHRQAPNSLAVLAARLKLYRSVTVACFAFWRKISRYAFWDFCNNIDT
jgi:hypothetical protein